MIKLELCIPEGREACAVWIQKQTADIVADALSLCEQCFNMMQKNLNSADMNRLLSECAELKDQLDNSEAIYASRLRMECQKTREATETQLKMNHEQSLAQMADQLKSEKEDSTNRKRYYEERVACMNRERQELENQLATTRAEVYEAAMKENDEKVARIKQAQIEEKKNRENKIKQLSDELALLQTSQKAAHYQELDTIRNFYESKADQAKKEHTTQCEMLREQLTNTNKQLEAIFREKEDVVLRSKCEMKTLLDEQKNFISNLRGSNTNVGQFGENFVARVFAGLQLGQWTDKHAEASCGDALWEWSANNSGGPLRCLIEIKNAASLHSQKDIAKFWSNVDSNVRCGKINAAMLISLSARIAGARPIDLKIHSGIPVFLASRDSFDGLPAATLVEFAFHSFASMWPAVARNVDGDEPHDLTDAFSRYLNAAYDDFEALSKRINLIERSAITIQREATALRKQRDAMVNHIDQFKTLYPQLVPADNEETEEEVSSYDEFWETDLGNSFLNAVEMFKNEKRGRYPKEMADLKLDETISSSVATIPNVLEKAVSLVKARQTRKRARTAAEE